MTRRTKPLTSLNGLLRDLYGSLSEELRFEHALHRLGTAFRSNVTGLHAEDFGAHRGRVTLVGDMSATEYLDFSAAYSSRWSGENLWMLRSLEGFQKQGYQHGEAVVSDSQLLASTYYRHALKPMDLRYGLGIQLWSDNKLNMAVAAFHRGHGSKGFDADDIALVKQLRVHLVNAYAIYRRLAHLADQAVSLRACFDHAPSGMLVLDERGHVLESNTAAEHWLPLAGIKRTCDGRLIFSARAMQQHFDLALKSLADHQPAMPKSLRLKMPTGSAGPAANHCVLHLCAVPLGMLSGVRRDARTLVFIADLLPHQSEAVAEHILRQTLLLSPTEARIALALRRHVDVAAAAHDLNIRPATVRTHLRNIHMRLGIGRTADFLVLIERLIGSAPRSDEAPARDLNGLA